MKKSIFYYGVSVVAYFILTKYLKNQEAQLVKGIQSCTEKLSSFLTNLTKNMSSSPDSNDSNKLAKSSQEKNSEVNSKNPFHVENYETSSERYHQI